MARTFNGSTDYIGVAYPDEQNKVAIAITFKLSATGSQRMLLYHGTNIYATYQKYMTWNADNTVRFQYTAFDGAATSSSYFSATQDTSWHRLVWCWDYDANTVAAYWDGAAQSTTDSNITNTPDPDSSGPMDIHNIGRGGSSAYVYFAGDMAEIAIWTDVILTPGQAIAYTKGYSPLAIRRANLARYWPLLGNDSNERDIITGVASSLTGTTKAAHPGVIYPRKRQVYVGAVVSGQTEEGGGMLLGSRRNRLTIP